MSYIRVDKGIFRKPKFRSLLRATGLEEHVALGYVVRIWIVVDEIGERLEGDDEIIADAVEVPVGVLRALVQVGWADRFEGGISFRLSEDSARARTEAHRARAARSYDRKRGDSAPLCAQTAQSAPPTNQPTNQPTPPPPVPRARARARARVREGSGGGGGGEAPPKGEADSPSSSSPRWAWARKTLAGLVDAGHLPGLMAEIERWPESSVYDRLSGLVRESKNKNSPAGWLAWAIRTRKQPGQKTEVTS